MNIVKQRTIFNCSEICPHDQILELPKYTEEAEEVVVETRSYCDCVGCVGQKAICYCIDCGKCLCKFHNEVSQLVALISVSIVCEQFGLESTAKSDWVR